MNSTLSPLLAQHWSVTQHELIPFLRNQHNFLTPKLEQIIRTLEWVRVEEHLYKSYGEIGRPAHDRSDFARAFVAKAVLGLERTRDLIERLEVDARLKRICGFMMHKELPSESTFSRVFAELSESQLASKAHAAMIKAALGDQLIGHISRDATAIEARERAHTMSTTKAKEVVISKATELFEGRPKEVLASAPVVTVKRRGRPKKGEVRPAPALGKVAEQRQKTVVEMIAAMPKQCDIGIKKNAKGFMVSWKGWKLHLDTADCGVVISSLVSAASMHDSMAAIPLMRVSSSRVTYCYELMDAAYSSIEIHEESTALGHVALIDHNPRGGEKKEFAPHEAERYKERAQAERTNARLKDEFGLRQIWVRGFEKASSHMSFAVLALTADQLMRLMQ
jgi:transposase